MARFLMTFTIAAAISFAFLTSTSGGNQLASPTTSGESRHEFELPQMHTSTLTPAEQAGSELYGYYCAVCHGKTGDGDGFNSSQLTTPPAKHADPVLMATLSDAKLEEVIKGGGPALGRSPQMPPWGRVLSDRDVANLVAFIRVLSKK